MCDPGKAGHSCSLGLSFLIRSEGIARWVTQVPSGTRVLDRVICDLGKYDMLASEGTKQIREAYGRRKKKLESNNENIY